MRKIDARAISQKSVHILHNIPTSFPKLFNIKFIPLNLSSMLAELGDCRNILLDLDETTLKHCMACKILSLHRLQDRH